MNLLQSLKTALEMLRMHKLRAFLTMLGVIIGVMSVTIIIMVSSGFQFYMTNEFKKLGSDTIFISYDSFSRRQRASNIDGLKLADLEHIENRVRTLDVIAPVVQAPAEKMVRGTREISNPRVYASNENFLLLNRVNMKLGRPLTADDTRLRSNVCLIGEEIQERLFGTENPIGKLVTFKGITLEVVGVFERLDIMGESNAKDALVPLSTAQDKWLGGDKLMMIMTRPKPGMKVEPVMDDIWQALMLRSNNKRIYRVDSRESIMNVFGNVFNVAGIVLSAVAALSLLVGGIGIMNIMLVSVTERTREIGLRKAVGARRNSIMIQFMVESATLSLVGGLIGMAIAFGLGKLVTLATATANWPSKGGLPTTFPIVGAIGAALFSALIGVVFGLYPAVSASRLDPIVALRRE
ncbi:MAG: ABC transporter permease [Fimbriimonadaceae bacterium]|nr:ABC transporter permease [Fimbriimonadaceae bacterium]